MRKYLTILFLFISLLAKSTTFYVDVAGSNANPGSVLLPWETLSHAATQVSDNDSIFFLDGTHILSSGVDIPVRVSLLGNGNTSIIHSTITGDYSAAIYLSSGATGTIGAQSISHLRFTGVGNQADNNFTYCIKIEARDSVSIHDCEFEDFDDNAVTNNGQPYDGSVEPSLWAKGFMFYNNTLINCCKRQTYPSIYMSGALQIGTQEGCEIYDNYFREDERGITLCGYPIKYVSEGFNRRLKIHDNTIIKHPSGEDDWDWNFAIELWNYRGEVEIYDNRIYGSIDIDSVQKFDLEFGLKVYGNHFGYDTLPSTSGYRNLNAGLYIEFACADIEIYNNLFNNLESVFRFSPRQDDYFRDVNIHHNIIGVIGNNGSTYDNNILDVSPDGGVTQFDFYNFKFENNTIYTYGTDVQNGILLDDANGDHHNSSFNNNIFSGFGNYPIIITSGDFDTLSIQNNNYHSNINNTSSITITPSNYTNSGNITTDPLFVNAPTDLSLQETSLAINAGLDLGYTTDYLGNPIEGLSDIGAYEYQSTPEIPSITPVIRNKCHVMSSGRPRIVNGKILMQ